MSLQGRKLVNEKIREIANEEGLTSDETILMLCSLYNLENIDTLINRISHIYKQGMNKTQISKLKILTSYLKSVVDKVENF